MLVLLWQIKSLPIKLGIESFWLVIKCFYLNPTSPTEVANIVHSLKNSKCEGFYGPSISPVKDTIDLIAALWPISAICHFLTVFFQISSKQPKSFPSSNVITRPCSLTTGLFLFPPVFPRSSKNSFTSDCLHFLKHLTFLVTINMASDHIILQLWRSSNL